MTRKPADARRGVPPRRSSECHKASPGQQDSGRPIDGACFDVSYVEHTGVDLLQGRKRTRRLGFGQLDGPVDDQPRLGSLDLRTSSVVANAPAAISRNRRRPKVCKCFFSIMCVTLLFGRLISEKLASRYKGHRCAYCLPAPPSTIQRWEDVAHINV